MLHVEKGGLQNLAAHIVEIDVDAAGAGRPQLGEEVTALVVDRRIIAELFGEQMTLGRAARHPNHLTAPDLGDLTDDRAHASRGG